MNPNFMIFLALSRFIGVESLLLICRRRTQRPQLP
jgi:hypothetical protein